MYVRCCKDPASITRIKSPKFPRNTGYRASNRIKMSTEYGGLSPKKDSHQNVPT